MMVHTLLLLLLIMLVPIELSIGKKLIKILKKNKLIMLIGWS